MDYGLDTSALLRIVTSDPPSLAVKVARAIQLIIEDGGTIHVSDSVVQEAYFALQHHYGATKEDAVLDLRAISQADGFFFSNGAKEALAEPIAARMAPGLVDRMIVAGYGAQGLRTISCERSFRRLSNTLVIAEAQEQK